VSPPSIILVFIEAAAVARAKDLLPSQDLDRALDSDLYVPVIHSLG
jgi:hypothetical protein